MRLNKFAFIVTFVALFAFVEVASAQWYLGPRAGLNMMTISTNEAVTTNYIPGYHAGLTLRKQLSKQINIQMDVLYAQMGGNLFAQEDLQPFAPMLIETETDIYYNYVQTPIYANIEFPFKPKRLVPYFDNESWSSFHLYGGGYFGYAMSTQAQTTVRTYTVEEDKNKLESEVVGSKTAIADSTFSPIDFGIMVGFGISFKLNEEDKQRLGIDFRYQYGFANTVLPTVLTKGVNRTNSAAQVSLFYTWKLTKRKHIRYTR